MPDPIASGSSTSYRRWESDDDDLTCKETATASSATDVHETTRSSGDAVSTASNDSAGVQGPRAEAHAEAGDLYAGAFVLKGRDRSGVEVEVFSASAHQGEHEQAVQAGMARMGGSTDNLHFSARGEAFTAQARVGEQNADGSTGLGASIGATVVGGELTGTLGFLSLTGGASIGATYGASVGVRDSDHDGKTEYCGRLDFGVGSAGACVEKFW